MGERRMNIQAVADKTGLSRPTISALYHDKAKRIDYDTLNALCSCFDCTPGELLEYHPDTPNQVSV